MGDVIFAAVFAAALFAGNRMINVDGDTGRHLTVGRYILNELKIPTQDIFSHTMTGVKLVPHEWLSQLLMAAAYRLFEMNGVVILIALALSFVFYRLYRQSLRRSHMPLISAGLILLAVAATSFHWLARPHVFSYLLLVIWMDILDAVVQGRRMAWLWMPAAMLAWVNLHGGFVIGFAVLGLTMITQWLAHQKQVHGEGDSPSSIGRLAAGGAASLVVTLINPAGYRIWITSLGYLQNRYLTGHTWEYLPPDLNLPAFWPFILTVGLGIYLLAMVHSRRTISEAVLFAGLAVPAFLSARAIPIFILVVTPFLAGWAELALSKHKRQELSSSINQRIAAIEAVPGISPITPFLLAGACLLAGITPREGVVRQPYQFSENVFPVQARQWLETNPINGNMFNYFPWGGYLLFENWPEMRVFIDGQTDFYGEGLTREYEQALTAAPGWQEVLQKYDVSWVILPPGEPLVSALATDPGWNTVYQDQTTAIISHAP